MAPQHSGQAITSLKITPYGQGDVTVTSPAIDPEDRLDSVHAKTGDETSPPLRWTGPAETVSWALVVEDPDAPQDKPVVHWMAWNIPARITSLPAGVAKTARPDELQGGVQGLNTHDKPGWMGMAPPPGDTPHHYYFQIFALDRELELDPTATRTDLVNQLKGATLAQGEVDGTFETPDGSGGASG